MTILFYLKPGQQMPPSGWPGYAWDEYIHDGGKGARKAKRKRLIEKRRLEKLRKDEEELLLLLLMEEL